MAQISKLEVQQRNPQRVNVHLDGRFAFGLSARLAQELGLQVGQHVSAVEVEEVLSAEERGQAQEAALNFLSYRPRSEAEVRRRLRRGGFGEDLVAGVVAKLRQQGLLDDGAFAAFWAENRTTFSPRGARLVKQELRAKGVDAETAQGATAAIDEEEGAYRAATRKARTLAGTDWPTFRRKLGDFLVRRGFDYEVVEQTVKRLWDEAGKPHS